MADDDESPSPTAPSTDVTPVTPAPGAGASVQPAGPLTPQPAAEKPQAGVQPLGSVAAASDSEAGGQAPTLPPRTYSRDPRLLSYTPTLSRRLPSTLVPRFIRFLAWFIFMTGSSAALAAVLYQHYVYPKLKLTTDRLTELYKHALPFYDKMILHTSALRDRPDSVFRPALQQTPGDGQGIEKDVVASGPLDDNATAAGDDVQAEPPMELHPAASMLLPLRESLRDLEAAIDDSQSSAIVGSSRESQSQQFLQSLEMLSTKLSNEAIYASTTSYSVAAYGYSYTGMANKMPARGGVDNEKVVALRNELRSLKGMLLTR